MNNTLHLQSAFRPRISEHFAKRCREPHTSCEVGQIYRPHFTDGETEAQRSQVIRPRVPQTPREGTGLPGTRLPLARLTKETCPGPGACTRLCPKPRPRSGGCPEPSRGRPASRAPGPGLRGALRTTAPTSGQVGSDLSRSGLRGRQHLTFPPLPCPPNPRLPSAPAPLAGCKPPQPGRSRLSFDTQF